MCRLRSLYVDIWTHTAEEVILLCLHLLLPSLYSFLIRHGRRERKVRLHPSMCLRSSGNKCVGGITGCIFPKLTCERFVPSGNVDWILHTRGNESRAFIRRQNKHRVFCFVGLKDTFPTLFIISIYCRNLIALQSHPKPHLDAEETSIHFGFFMLHLGFCLMLFTCLHYGSWQGQKSQGRFSEQETLLRFHLLSWSRLGGKHQKWILVD